MSFGFGVGDFIAVGQLALKLYNACANAPGDFQELRRDLSSVHTVLYSLQSQSEDPTSLLRQHCGDRKPEWIRLQQNLEATLLELQDLVKRYNTMGKNAWLRVQLGLKHLSDLRGKLSIHLNAINVFVGSLALSSLGRLEPTLGRIESILLEFVKEERLGQKQPTVLSAHEDDNGPAWKQLELDLQLSGISREDFERNQDRIKELLHWVVNDERNLIGLRDVDISDSISQQDYSQSVVQGPLSNPPTTEPTFYTLPGVPSTPTSPTLSTLSTSSTSSDGEIMQAYMTPMTTEVETQVLPSLGEPVLVRVKILILDYDATHFGVMFKRDLDRPFSGTFGPWKNYQRWRPLFDVDIVYGDKNDIHSNYDKMRATLRRQAYSKSSFLHRYSSEVDPSTYDFILFVPFQSEACQPRGFPTYADLKKQENVFDVLSLASDDFSPVSKTNLTLPYSTSLIRHRRRRTFFAAQDQVHSCSSGFLSSKLNYIWRSSLLRGV